MRRLVRGLLLDLRQLPANLQRALRPGAEGRDSPAHRWRRSFIDHLHPLRVTERALRPTTTFGLGFIALALLLLLTLSGLLLMIYYVPTPERAWQSVQEIHWAVAFGGLMRRVHRFAGHALVLVAALHLARVVVAAAYRGREFNWLVGVTLLLLLLGLAFTGYLLPWDQTAYWAVTVVANMMAYLPVLGEPLKHLLLGADTVGPAALVRFYALHVAVLPGLAALLVALHLWRVRRDGLASDRALRPTVAAWPHLLARELALFVSVSAACVWAALLIAAPLGPVADASQPANPEKAPWYFLGVQEMVSQSAEVGGVVAPLLGLGLLFALPFFDRRREQTGRFFGAAAERRAVGAVALVALLGWVALQSASAQPEVSGWIAARSTWLREWLTPSGAAVIAAGVAFFWAGTRAQSARAALHAALVVLAVLLIGSTVVGAMRGPDWQLFWPWEAWPGVR